MHNNSRKINSELLEKSPLKMYDRTPILFSAKSIKLFEQTRLSMVPRQMTGTLLPL